MNAGEVCTREVVIAHEDDTIIEAARRMRAHHVGDVVVVREEDGRRFPIGILTDRDLVVSVLAQDPEDINKLLVSEVITGDLITAAEDDDVFELLKRMRARGIRRLPVVDERRRLVGIITYDDIVDLVAEELTDLARLVARERNREAELRS